MYRKYLGIGILGAGTLGTLVSLHKNDYETNAIALVRISRATFTVFNIGYCYQKNLYSKGLDQSSEEYIELRNKVHKIGAEKLLQLCKTNKGIYIKVGQHVGALDYLLPPEYVETLRVLHKDAPAENVENLFKTIKEELEQKPEDLFIEFDKVPLGTASLAQVHKAKLKDGTSVAVKVQHRFVKKNTKADLRSMEVLVNIMSRAFPDFNMEWLVNETKRNIYKELDFMEEGHNAEKVAEMFKHYSWLKIPKIIWNYSTNRLLVMEYVEGGQVNDFQYMKEHNINVVDLCRKIGDLYSHMIFINGFVHSDPHPGNILVKKNQENNDITIYLLDHGLYASLTDDFRYQYSQLWLSVINKDFSALKYHAEKLGIKDDMYIALACIVTGRPWSVIQKGISQIKPDALERDTVRNQLPNVLNHIVSCLQNIDRQALLILKTNDLIRGIEYTLKTSELMCGFMIMTKCCLISSYNQRLTEVQNSTQKIVLHISQFFTMFKFYLTCMYINVRAYFYS